MPFIPDQTGYIRHWMVTPVNTAPYKGEPGSEPDLRKCIIEPVGTAPQNAKIGEGGPHDESWGFYDPAQNIFVEQSGFWHNLSVLNTYGVTHLIAPEEGRYRARFWSCGAGDLWIDGNHIIRNLGVRYMYPDPVEVTLNLSVGINELACRVQALGVRDTRLLFGLQLLQRADKFQIQIPGPESLTNTLRNACDWLDSLHIQANTCIKADCPQHFPVIVNSKQTEHNWPSNQDSLDLPKESEKVDICLTISDQVLCRTLEIPSSRNIKVISAKTIDETRQHYISTIASQENKGRGGVMNVLARHAIGDRSDADTSIIEAECDWIDDRPDCADFPLSALLRLIVGSTLTEAEHNRIRKTALDFRYWDDEPGNDALCFRSENHSLLFHSCQMIAGDLFSDQTFTNCERTGAEQSRIGKERCSSWLDDKEENGFHEFLSSTYIPLTVGALLNVVDFANDKAMSEKASRLIDRLFTVIAEHAFDGVTVGPQGRVYRNILTPDESGTQAMLAYATPNAVSASNDWISFLGASDGYAPPANLSNVMAEPTSKTYSEASVEITLKKTANYLLTSLQIPASWQKEQARVDPAYATVGLIPGRQGYQQHLWHATLGRDCHIFVNHPGATFDMSSSRPGFWYGNGFLPKLAQKDNVVAQVFNTPDDHPIPFTHAHWPLDGLDESDIQTHWAFGRKGSGCIALWCSQSLTVRSEVLTDHELRADGRQVAWMCYCGSGSFDAFKVECLATNPEFDRETLALSSAGICVVF